MNTSLTQPTTTNIKFHGGCCCYPTCYTLTTKNAHSMNEVRKFLGRVNFGWSSQLEWPVWWLKLVSKVGTRIKFRLGFGRVSGVSAVTVSGCVCVCATPDAIWWWETIKIAIVVWLRMMAKTFPPLRTLNTDQSCWFWEFENVMLAFL